MTTCREFFTFSWPLRGRGGGVNPSGQPDRFFPVFFLALPLETYDNLDNLDDDDENDDVNDVNYDTNDQELIG